MPVSIKNFSDKVAETYVASKKVMTKALQQRLGPPPSSVANRAQSNDEYRAYWKLGKGWEDPTQHAARAQAMYALGAKPADVMRVMYPYRVELIPYGERKGDIEAQVKFCKEMVAQRMEALAGAAVALSEQLESSGAEEEGA